MDRNPIDEIVRQQNQSNRKNGSLLSGISMGLIFVIIGVTALSGSGLFGAVWILVGIAIVASSAKAHKKRKLQEQAAQTRPPQKNYDYQTVAAAPAQKVRAAQPSRPAQAAAPKQAERCDNPEQHRHFTPDTADTRAKRRESMKTLYEAGLLTKEEYNERLRLL